MGSEIFTDRILDRIFVQTERENILNASVHERMLPEWIFLLRLTFCCSKTVCLTTVYFHTHVQKRSKEMSVLFLSPISAPLVLID